MKEIAYRGITGTPDLILDDIIQTTLLIAKREKNKVEPYLGQYKEIQAGLLQFKTYQVTSFFRIDEAITTSAKAALLAAMIKTGSSGATDIFTGTPKKESYLNQHPDYNFLNKLPVEPLFYWNKTVALLSKYTL